MEQCLQFSEILGFCEAEPITEKLSKIFSQCHRKLEEEKNAKPEL